MSELNPCPLCGNEPDLTVYRGYIKGVVCECGLAVDVGATNGDAAINGWNDVTANFTQPVKTLRDEFAMAAMSGLLGNSGGPVQRSCQSGWSLVNCHNEDISEFAYQIADAMLKERSK